MRRRLLIVSAVATFVAVAAAAALSGWTLLRPGPDREVVLEVPEGASVGEVLAAAGRSDLLPSVLAARAWWRLVAGGRPIRWGRYTVPPGTRPVDLLRRLVGGVVDQITVTVIEGSTVEDVGDRMTAAGIGDAQAWRTVAANTSWIADLAPRAPSLEGFLFPDTYRFAVGTPPSTAAHHLVDHFRTVWSELVSGERPWASALEIVTLASLVEAETNLPEERSRIAGVFVNRLRRGMLLQCDPTVVYALRRLGRWTGRLRHVDLEVDHPYNTYRFPGLPPGPINSPGRAALQAALHPMATEDLYFVARPDGGHTFSRTLREHNLAVVRLRRAAR
jgi:UPF0755 protein